jgi:hypothetical protein
MKFANKVILFKNLAYFPNALQKLMKTASFSGVKREQVRQ